jgi:hypothetical protein
VEFQGEDALVAFCRSHDAYEQAVPDCKFYAVFTGFLRWFSLPEEGRILLSD